MGKARRLVVAAVVVGALVAFPSTASAYVSSGLLVYLDASDPSSFSNVSSAWQDLSSNNVDGTFFDSGGAAISYDAVTESLVFPGGTHGTAWVQLDTSTEKFDDFSAGFTMEFEGEFGASRATFERIFDFAENDSGGVGDNETDYSFWLGHFGNSNELALEIFDGGLRQGYCHTSTGSTVGYQSPRIAPTGTALGGSGVFAKWVVTIDNDANKTCKIYKDGVALPVLVHESATADFYTADSGSTSGAAFTLPPIADRESALVGGSNFTADADFEGSIRYLRIYNTALSSSEVEENAGISLAGSASNDNDSGQSGIFLYIAGQPARKVEETPIYYGSVSIKPNSTYILSIQSVSNPALTRTVLATGTTNSGGHADYRLEMSALSPGTYKVVMTGTHRLGYPLVLTNYISVDGNGNFVSLSPESLQPTLS